MASAGPFQSWLTQRMCPSTHLDSRLRGNDGMRFSGQWKGPVASDPSNVTLNEVKGLEGRSGRSARDDRDRRTKKAHGRGAQPVASRISSLLGMASSILLPKVADVESWLLFQPAFSPQVDHSVPVRLPVTPNLKLHHVLCERPIIWPRGCRVASPRSRSTGTRGTRSRHTPPRQPALAEGIRRRS